MKNLCEICIFKGRFEECQMSACPTAHSYPVEELKKLVKQLRKEKERLENESISYGHLNDDNCL